MKKALVLLLVLAAMMIPAFASGSGEQQVTTLTLSEVHAEGYPTTLADYEFARLVEEATEGRIKIEVFSGGTLYGEETGAIEALQTPAEKELADAKAALQTVIDTAKKFDTAGFSKEQLAALEAAIADAEEALASDDVAVVTAAKTALEAALAVTPENPDTSDTNVVVFAVLATLSLVAAGFVVAKKRKA